MSEVNSIGINTVKREIHLVREGELGVSTIILSKQESYEGFYPTPFEVAKQMLSDVDWNKVEFILEPSAGKGDLVEHIARLRYEELRYDRRNLDVDCIELDPYLRQVLKYNFSRERTDTIRNEYAHISKKAYQVRTEDEHNIMKEREDETNIIESVNLHIIHDDFLTFRSGKRYDLIVMNPPFADGDRHLLKAIELQESSGGQIICLLNAESLRNPYTKTREVLNRQLSKYDAEIEFIDNAFSSAERATNVSIAIIKLNIPKRVRQSTIYDTMKKAEEQHTATNTAKELVVGDYIEQEIQRYNVEVSATLELVKQYEALKPYIVKGLTDCYGDSDPIISLTVRRDYRDEKFEVNTYMRAVRMKYWRGLFNNDKFTGMLTSNLQDEYRKTVEKMADYDFSMFNIMQVLAEMRSRLSEGLQDTILSLFDKLSVEHSYYPECTVNRQYFNGWKTNLAHKIGKKAIIPTHGMFSDYSWSKRTFEVSTAYAVLSDIEKVFNYLDGGETPEIDLLSVLTMADRLGTARNIDCKYFTVTLYKKGTTHIKFKNHDLIEKLNIYAARNKKWLPPNYGKKRYEDLDAEEREVIDSFQGEEEYRHVMSRRDYFLGNDTSNLLLLGAGNI